MKQPTRSLACILALPRRDTTSILQLDPIPAHFSSLLAAGAGSSWSQHLSSAVNWDTLCQSPGNLRVQTLTTFPCRVSSKTYASLLNLGFFLCETGRWVSILLSCVWAQWHEPEQWHILDPKEQSGSGLAGTQVLDSLWVSLPHPWISHMSIKSRWEKFPSHMMFMCGHNLLYYCSSSGFQLISRALEASWMWSPPICIVHDT